MARLPKKSNYEVIDEQPIVVTLIHFIEAKVELFTNSQSFQDNYLEAVSKAEDQLSTAFCIFFNLLPKNEIPYSCATEIKQIGNNKIDLGFFNKEVLIFVMEAKILPTPLENDRKEHEYVYGKGGGIQRFKEIKHGVNFKHQLFRSCGMIAYIKEQDFDYWFAKVNQWIMDTNWLESEKLTRKYPNQNDKYISDHSRIDNSTLKLHHFWVRVA